MKITNFSLKPHGLLRPEKIRWIFPSDNNQSVLEQIPSKSLRKFLKNTDSVLQEQQITWESCSINKDKYLSWLQYYRENMTQRGYRVIADEEWYDDRVGKGYDVEGIFFYKDKKTIGTAIYLTSEKNKLANLAFRAHEKINLVSKKNSSFGAIISYIFTKTQKERGMKTILSGRSQNAFGILNTIGYLSYKLSFGYQPIIPESTPLLDFTPVDGKTTTLCFCNTTSKDDLTLVGIKLKGSKSNLIVPQRFLDKYLYREIEY